MEEESVNKDRKVEIGEAIDFWLNQLSFSRTKLLDLYLRLYNIKNTEDVVGKEDIIFVLGNECIIKDDFKKIYADKEIKSIIADTLNSISSTSNEILKIKIRIEKLYSNLERSGNCGLPPLNDNT